MHPDAIQRLRPPTAGSPLFFSDGSPLAAIVRRCEKIAASDATVLVTGETGTGKEVMARFIHTHSPRAAKNFVAVNCGAIPEALVESELFGHVKGAFTGANASRKGRVALAEGGTLFLDEIGELPLSLQVKLLRLLQERSYEPVGSAESVRANFRLIAATNRDLAAEVEAGRFRRDLYYRLLVCPVQLPALRERPGDIRGLLERFWSALGEARPVEPEVYEMLGQYPWPGNIRELENLAERLSVCAEGQVLTAADVPPEFKGGALPLPLGSRPASAQPPAGNVVPFPAAARAAAVAAPIAGAISGAVAVAPVSAAEGERVESVTLPVNLPELLRAIEDRYIEAALKASQGNKKAAADLLGLQRTTLVEKLRRREPRPQATATELSPAPLN